MKIRDLQRLCDDVLMKYGNIEVVYWDGVPHVAYTNITGSLGPPMLSIQGGLLLTDEDANTRYDDLHKVLAHEAAFQHGCNQAELDIQQEETGLAKEYRDLWDALVLRAAESVDQDVVTRATDENVSEGARQLTRTADALTEERAKRFGVKDAPQFLGLCKCGNHLVCDGCHCSKETCKCGTAK
jgi:hypothetical protein